MFDINFPKFLGRSRVKLDVIVLYVTPKLLLPRSFLTKTRHPSYYLALIFGSSWVWQKILVLSVPQTNKVGYLLLQMLSRSSKNCVIIWKSISYNDLIKVSFWIDLHFAYKLHLYLMYIITRVVQKCISILCKDMDDVKFDWILLYQWIKAPVYFTMMILNLTRFFCNILIL